MCEDQRTRAGIKLLNCISASADIVIKWNKLNLQETKKKTKRNRKHLIFVSKKHQQNSYSLCWSLNTIDTAVMTVLLPQLCSLERILISRWAKKTKKQICVLFFSGRTCKQVSQKTQLKESSSILTEAGKGEAAQAVNDSNEWKMKERASD